MNKNSKNLRTSNSNRIKVPNYDANQSRIKINKIIEEKNIEKMRRKIKLIFTFVLIGIVICSIYLILKLPYFNIQSIEVEGNNFYTKGDIVANLTSELGKNIFVERFINDVNVDLPYIESTKTRIIFPNRLLVIIQERESMYFAYDKEFNCYYKLDKNGYILQKCNDINEKNENEYLIHGISFSKDVVLGTKIDQVYIDRLNKFCEIKAKIDESFSSVITKVNFDNFLTTITLDDKLNVKFNVNGDINYSISLLKAIMDKIPEGSVGLIDMTKTDPTFSSY